ncbi:MAG TPA: addiction module protein [Opitutaceae bacterium]|nr:addiction module protein [Opitutaceae bacterium]
MLQHPRAVRPEFQETRLHLGRHDAAGEPRPLHRAKPVRHECLGFARVVDHDRQDERDAGCDAAGTLCSHVPLEAKVAFVSRLRVRRDERDEQNTLLDLPPDLRVPLVAVLESAFDIEPHLDAGGAERFAKTPRRFRILRGVGQENGFGGFAHSGRFLPVDVNRRGNIVPFMAKVLSEVTRDALDLSPAQRRTLARILLDVSEDSLDFSPELETLWDDEIVGRLKAVKDGTAKSRSADDVFADLDRRFPR